MNNNRTHAPQLAGSNLTIGYGERTVASDLSVTIPEGSFTVIIGPNGCGKSTLLRALARLLKPSGGSVTLDGKSIHSIPTKELARNLGLLPQTSIAPDGITVRDLVSRGRHPYHSLLKRWDNDDEKALGAALSETKLLDLMDRPIDELSGGQRQRAWIAMALAQDTPLLLLDEPTTYLDIRYQLDVLDLCLRLQQQGRTLVAVLHDLNQALRYATHVIAMREGKIVAQGAPAEVGTPTMVHNVFDVDAHVITDPVTGSPLVLPLTAHAREITSATRITTSKETQ